ncbi:MAG: OmpA family protein [Alphaproteobacteria bacterium]|nr:OmpA family protein [Alphaproteobacteria bacterium]
MSDRFEKESEGPNTYAPRSICSVRRNAAGEEEAGVSLWLITFTDIMALMLTFFVLMYSMSTPAEDKWRDISQGLNSRLTGESSPEWYESGPKEINIGRLSFSEALNLGYLSTLLGEIIAQDEQLNTVILIPGKDYLVVSLPEDLLFTPGAAEVSEKGHKALFALGGGLSRIRNRMEVIGHTGPRVSELKGSVFDSNWTLSLARAANVAAVLENIGYTKPMVIRGLADGRYQDLPKGMPEAERLALTRRVDLLIMRDDGSQKQPLEFAP